MVRGASESLHCFFIYLDWSLSADSLSQIQCSYDTYYWEIKNFNENEVLALQSHFSSSQVFDDLSITLGWYYMTTDNREKCCYIPFCSRGRRLTKNRFHEIIFSQDGKRKSSLLKWNYRHSVMNFISLIMQHGGEIQAEYEVTTGQQIQTSLQV